ncbi:hypothetical protein VNO78_35131 [Psophocarpus tetragonolobus]|uniref:Uncharacterized protein n=1 Tax=Psophocarpus tetragonolobus TaxID=3891 RepID=A0AAN9NNS1_PSOTE
MNEISFFYLSWIPSMNQVEFFGFPEAPNGLWIVSANEMNAEPVPNASLLRSGSSREENKMLPPPSLCLFSLG